MIRTENLKYQHRGGPVISFPDLEVERGASLLILGESGCGKTTLLHLLAALLRPTSGRIMVDDQDLSALSQARADAFRGKNIGLVYQKSYFIEALTTIENLVISPFAPDYEKAIEVAQHLEIGHLLDKLPSRLSVGEQQRATIARAILHDPKLILADEPTSALDAPNCEKVAQLLKEQARLHNAALIIVTHDDRLRNHFDHKIELDRITRKATS